MVFIETDLFKSGENGYHTYRIPALAATTRGTLLAFCEGRKHGMGDAGEIDLLLRRSFNNGATWQEVQRIATEAGMTCGNPCPVADSTTGTIWLPFNKNYADGGEQLICEGKAPRTVWLTKSTDEGATWSPPWEITREVKDPSWTWYATGPCHGIQLESGRLVVPCDHIVGEVFDGSKDPVHSHIIYSDDHGASWKRGGVVEGVSDECTLVQTADGRIYVNCRKGRVEEKNRRGFAWSSDEGITFSPLAWDETLIDPVCQGSLVRFTKKAHTGKNRVLFSNCASEKREKLTVRTSYDECRSWEVSRTIYPGPSAYSDLAISSAMEICCFHERGVKHPYEKLILSRFDLEWLSSGADRL